jgi:hypothetical protein
MYKFNDDVREKTKIIEFHRLNWMHPRGGSFIFHAFGYGNHPYRSIDYVYADRFGIPIEEVSTETLLELSHRHPSDKEPNHSYFSRVYDSKLSSLKTSVTRVMELGVAEGYSLLIWRDFFKNATVVGVDIDASTGGSAKAGGRIILETFDVSKRPHIEQLVEKYPDTDIIIDDASHTMDQQQITFATLFKAVRSGGMYIIEDLHTSNEVKMPEKAAFCWGDPNRTTTLDMLRNYLTTGEMVSDYLTTEECEYLKQNIWSVEIFDELGPLGGIVAIIRKNSEVVKQPTLVPTVDVVPPSLFSRITTFFKEKFL